MLNFINELIFDLQANLPYVIVLAGLGIGVLVTWLGLASGVSGRDPALRRMRALTARGSVAPGQEVRLALIKREEIEPKGMLKSLLPEDQSERVEIAQELAMAGFAGADAVRHFFVMRLLLALIVPILLLMVLGLQKMVALPTAIDEFVIGLSNLRMLQITMGAVAIGYFAPTFWLKSRIKARRDRIERGFPNALDLMQISVEAGLGFDAAMARVGRELARISPEIAAEFVIVQTEIGAGRDRTDAMNEMARRMAITEARSFANVVGQSLKFGTSLSEALRGYAIEMRTSRELRAQEKANRLPVQMSGVMAILMLPALFLITLTPIVIRYMAMTAGN